MAFDGIVIANLVHDIKTKLEGGKINKIAQPEKDELLFTVKNNRETLRLSISASASLPLRISACSCENISAPAEL